MKGPARLLGPAEIRDLADLLGIQPTKKLGQNFVIDANTVRRIVNVAGVQAGSTVVEIGPGLGSLTLGLTEAGASVIAVEIDARLATQLPLTVAQLQPDVYPEEVAQQPSRSGRLTVITQDAMTITELPGNPTTLVANLPYNVSVPVLLHFLEHFRGITSGLVMVQAEVGERIAAEPGSKVYGSPSVKAAWYGHWKTSGMVSRQVFWPVPNVDSILVGFRVREQPIGTEEERIATFRIVDAAFGQRRKMLRQALAETFGSSADASAILEKAGIAPTRRGEQLTVHDFLAVARASWPGSLSGMAGVSEHSISDDKLVAATGRPRAEWHVLLDAQNASAWKHPQIASWLVETHGVDGWWAQGITVAYEQARGMRVPGQQPDGTFSTSSSKSLPGTQQEALDLVIDAYSAASGFEPASVSREARHPTARWKLADGTSILATISPGGAGKSRAVLTHVKLDSETRLSAAKHELATVLGELASRVDRSVD